MTPQEVLMDALIEFNSADVKLPFSVRADFLIARLAEHGYVVAESNRVSIRRVVIENDRSSRRL